MTSVRLLANENFPLPSVEVLRAAGHDVLAISECASQASDQEVLAIAVEQNRWILTFDRDYGELVFTRGLAHPPSIILLRLESYRPEQPGELLLRLFNEKLSFAGSFVVVETGRLRKRPLPIVG